MAAVHRTMTLGQNLTMHPSNFVILQPNTIQKSQQMYGKRPIAPAPTVLTSNGANQVQINVPKKKYNYGSMPYPSGQTASVARRNARERNRVKQVNNGFSNLRQHIPQTVITALTKGGRGASKKLSKVDTLKLAVEYIRSLKDLLEDGENSDSASASTSSIYSEKSQQYQSIPRSEASLSPTPSYSSDASSTMSYTPNHIQTHQMNFKQEPFDNYAEPSTSPVPSYHSDVLSHYSQHLHHHQMYPTSSTPYKPVHYNTYENNCSPVSSPDDDELLDAIAYWQQQ